MRNKFFFQFLVSSEQIKYTNILVNYSISSHPVSDIFKYDPDGQKRQREFRFTGTLGEILFADIYNLDRPDKSFGAIDGQDFGKDYELLIDGATRIIDVKTMHRKNNNLRTNYVLNLPAYQLYKNFSVTDTYFCISLHKNSKTTIIASFLGYIFKNEVLEGKIGILYKSGTKRIKDDLTSFVFQRDTYEIDFSDIYSPPLTQSLSLLKEFSIKQLLDSYDN